MGTSKSFHKNSEILLRLPETVVIRSKFALKSEKNVIIDNSKANPKANSNSKINFWIYFQNSLYFQNKNFP